METHEATAAYGGGLALEPVLTINETASLLRVSRSTIYDLINARELDTVRVGERIRIEPEAVRSYIGRRRGSGR